MRRRGRSVGAACERGAAGASIQGAPKTARQCQGQERQRVVVAGGGGRGTARQRQAGWRQPYVRGALTCCRNLLAQSTRPSSRRSHPLLLLLAPGRVCPAAAAGTAGGSLGSRRQSLLSQLRLPLRCCGRSRAADRLPSSHWLTAPHAPAFLWGGQGWAWVSSSRIWCWARTARSAAQSDAPATSSSTKVSGKKGEWDIPSMKAADGASQDALRGAVLICATIAGLCWAQAARGE